MVQHLFTFLFFFLAGPLFADCKPALSRLSPNNHSQSHDEIISDLSDGHIISGRSGRLNGNAHDLWFAKIYNPSTERTRDVVLKPREWGDNNGWGRSPMEAVAYKLNRLLGMDYVPPTVYRRHLEVHSHFIHESPVILFISDAEVLSATDRQLWGLSEKAVLSDNRVLNVLLHNQDAHEKNLLLGSHWVLGRKAPVFIDFGASLRPGTHVTMRKYLAAGNSAPVSQIRLATFEALQVLKREDLSALKKYLSDDELDGILSRRDGIVSYFSRLIKEQGEAAVLLQE